MTWDAYHRRAEVLREVVAAADKRRDGVLPWSEITDAESAFGTEDALLQALQMRWHTRLSGSLEEQLHEQPLDLEQAVVHAWRRTASELAVVRGILDAHAHNPALNRGRHNDWRLLATASGVAGLGDPSAYVLGRAIEDRARQVVLQPAASGPLGSGWLARLWHVLAA